MSFSGPLPHPALLQGYEKVFPGCAERIVKMAEEQSAHRRALEQARLAATNRTERLGQVFGFIIAMTAVLGGVYLAAIGKNALAVTSIIGALTTLLTVFVVGKRQQAQERREKRKPLEEAEQATEKPPPSR
jgi:uncharacterized membrane protein